MEAFPGSYSLRKLTVCEYLVAAMSAWPAHEADMAPHRPLSVIYDDGEARLGVWARLFRLGSYWRYGVAPAAPI